MLMAFISNCGIIYNDDLLGAMSLTISACLTKHLSDLKCLIEPIIIKQETTQLKKKFQNEIISEFKS